MDFRTQFVIAIFIVNIVIAPVLIKILGQKGFYKKKGIDLKKGNKAYYNHLIETMSTPSSFGILYILNLVAFTVISTEYDFLILLVTSLLLGILGLYDDVYQFFFHRIGNNWGLKARYKLLIQLIILFSSFYLLTSSFTLSLAYAIVASFVLNSFNITDGLDGLVGGISIPVLFTFVYMEYSTYGISNTFFLIVMTILFVLVFMIFNIKPAKVFLGDSGSYAIGTIIGLLTFRYSLNITLPLISIFMIEGLSSLAQILSIKIFKRKIFTIAPLHLHLLNNGWSQWKVIGGAWVLQIIITVILLFIYGK